MFDQANWSQLKLKRVRYIFPWDYAKHAGNHAEVTAFMNAARAKRQEVLATFSATRGCFVNNRYSKKKACKAPSQKAYKAAVKGFRKEFPYAKTFTPWNEVNHVSQPTYKKPKLAAKYYKTMKSACKGCTVMAADVLDSSDVKTYLRKFLRASKGKGRIWGLHNYKDVNRRQSKGVKNVLVRGQGQGLADRDGRHRELQAELQVQPEARRVGHEVHVQARAQVQARAADLRLPLLRRAAQRALRRRPGRTRTGPPAPRSSSSRRASRACPASHPAHAPGARASVPPACRGSISTPTRRPGRRRRCGRSWPRPRSATSSTSATRPSTCSASGWRSCSASRPPSSCPRARCATRSASGCTSGRAATRPTCTRSRTRSRPRAAAPPRSPGRCCARSRASAGCSTADTLAAAMRPPGDRYHPRSRLVSVEQTTNLAGGHVWPLAQLREVVEVAKANGLRLHMDGARLMNAVVASGVPTTEWTQGFDTAWIDFSKGLGAPMGAVLAGSAEMIDEAWRYKQMMGGALRQAGIVAAGALWALEHHVERLAQDHAHARVLAEGLAGVAGRRDRPRLGRHQHRRLPGRRRAGALHPARRPRRDHGRARRPHRPRGHASRRQRRGHRDARSTALGARSPPRRAGRSRRRPDMRQLTSLDAQFLGVETRADLRARRRPGGLRPSTARAASSSVADLCRMVVRAAAPAAAVPLAPRRGAVRARPSLLGRGPRLRPRLPHPRLARCRRRATTASSPRRWRGSSRGRSTARGRCGSCT